MEIRFLQFSGTSSFNQSLTVESVIHTLSIEHERLAFAWSHLFQGHQLFVDGCRRMALPIFKGEHHRLINQLLSRLIEIGARHETPRNELSHATDCS